MALAGTSKLSMVLPRQSDYKQQCGQHDDRNWDERTACENEDVVWRQL